jgi:PAS domain S-box-containing protein
MTRLLPCGSFMTLIHRISALAVLLGVLLLPFPATAEKTVPVLSVGSEIDFPPYAIVDATGRASGFSVELLEAVAETMGLPITVNAGPWPEVLAAFKSGKTDLLPLVALSAKRADMATYTKPHTVAYDSFFVRRGSPPISSLAEAKGKEVIAMSSDAAHDELHRSGLPTRIIETKTIPEAMRLLATGMHDAVLVPKLLGIIVLRELKLEGVIEAGKPVTDYNRQFAFAVQRGNTELRDKLEQGLAIIRTTGRYDAMYKKWFGGVETFGRHLKTIIVNNYHPYTFLNDKGVPDGFSVEIARAAAKTMGLELDIRADKWDQAMKELEAGSIDLLPMMAHSPERDKLFDFSVPHTIAYDAIFLKKGSSDLRTLHDLTGKTVIAMNSDITHSYLLSSGLSKTMTIIPVDSLPEALQQLAAGKADAAIMPKLVGVITAKKLNLTDLTTSPQLIDAYTRSFSFAVKDGNQALLERLNQGLNIIKSSGEYDAIYEKWFGALEGPKLHWKTVLKYGSVVVLILFGFLIWNVMLKRQVKAKTAYLEAEIFERKQVEEALRKSEERFKQMFRNHSAVMLLLEPESGEIIDANLAAEKFYGYSCEGLLSLNISNINILTPELVAAEMHAAVEEKRNHFIFPHKLADGEIRTVEVYSTPINVNNLTLLFSVVHDITERKKAEQELQNKNAEMERFAYTVSHDLKSPLITIQSYSGMIAQDLEAGRYERAREDIKRIEGAADKMTALLKDLLELSRAGRQMNESTEVNMNRLVKDTLAQLAGPLKQSQAEVVVQLDLPAVLGDSKRIAEVVQNLIENAIKYRGDQPALRIEIGTRQDGTECVFFISDNGKGIDSRHHEKVFGLFNKLDAESEGTGVGLALVKRIIEVHGGRVWVESEGEGMGSRFCFTIKEATK